jgi:hypothetical protein
VSPSIQFFRSIHLHPSIQAQPKGKIIKIIDTLKQRIFNLTLGLPHVLFFPRIRPLFFFDPKFSVRAGFLYV